MKYSRDSLMSPIELASEFELSPQTLADWRCYGGGPAYLKIGRRVWYPKEAVELWLESRLKGVDDACRSHREKRQDSVSLTPAPIRRVQADKLHRFGRHMTRREKADSANLTQAMQ